MNIEEHSLDLCNVKAKTNVDNDHNTEGVLPRISELMMDSDTGKQSIVSTEAPETYLMPQLTDNLQGAEGDRRQAQETLEIDEVNGNGKSGMVPDAHVLADPNDLFFSNEQHKENIEVEDMKEDKDAGSAKYALGDDSGDMDIGVDLSLDESGVLEGESADVRPLSRKIEHLSVTDPEPPAQDVPASGAPESPSDQSQECSTEASAKDQAVLPPTAEEGDSKHKQSGKRVTFPSDEDIVSGAVEPKDPWRHAQNATVDEILSVYKHTCQKLNCKPIPKLIKQIQELKDLTQRNECLDLKGEKLDYKTCESLEEVLKRVQFKLVDLEQTNLDEDGASALFDMIEYYESATHLNISFNKHIGTRGWQAAAHMMRKTSSLQCLDARNTPLLDHSAPFVARALRISGSLAVLHLENAGLSGRPLMLLATALKMNMNLRELYLADNKLNGLQDSAQLGNLLKFNYNIQILDLRNNHILDSGLAYVCEGLKEQRKGLVTLVLWNNQLTHNGMGYLAAALPFTLSLETLNLGHNSVGNEGIHKLKDGLIGNRSVLRLGLASTKLSCEGAVAVAEFIAESPRLLRLDLRENEIKTGGLMALSLALKVNTSLLRLDLDREPKKETVKSFIEAQRGLLAEIQNGCKRNFILAKEKEETEQQMRLSASMAEIATEDGTQEEEPAPEGQAECEEKEREEAEVKDETKGKEEETDSRPGTNSETAVSQTIQESDSDTDDEEEEVVLSKDPSTPDPTPSSNQTEPQTQAAIAQPPISASPKSSSPPASPASGGTSLITVTESPVPPGNPPSPGRCISVSSPGRGHKIFMVTRVESPPEQQQLQLQVRKDWLRTDAPAAPRQDLAKEITPTTQQTQEEIKSPAEPAQTQETKEEVKESSPALPEECKETEQSPAALNNKTLTHTLEAPNQNTEPSPPTQKVTLHALDPEETDPSLRAPSHASPEQVVAFQLKGEETESTTREEGEEGEEEGQSHADNSSLAVQPPQMDTSHAQLQNELASPSDKSPSQSPNQAEETEAVLAQQGQQEAPASPPENAKPAAGETEEEQEAEPSERPPSPPQAEDSPDDSSADDEEFFDDPLIGVEADEVMGSTLPNGLKPEFSLHLLDGESPKPGSCVMEHVSVSCGQDLEELLLEASLETGREAS
ncbi:protein phosphatase 1 regulatory subunit 37 [Genypterus blacodes]|uniref:protein phosphatase 1 regulatory subunit 37 n=1 Tax=Genypterus blacodes TaxID=154954 RepID=UPI003F75CD0D